MSDLFLKLINMSISASWLVFAVLILRLLLKKAPKWVNVLLWGIVAVRLVCPFSIESALSLIPSAETVPMNIEMDATPAIDSGITAVNSIINPVISASFTPEPLASANPLQIWIPVASILWIAGMVILLLYTAISYWLLRRKVSTAVLYNGNIFQSEAVSSPFVLGIIKPKIYLSFNMNGQALEHVVAHEQAHIRRKDHWWKPFGFLLLTLHWFNPLMWLAYVLLCRDIELACDEKVIKELSNAQRADYTQALVACSVNRRMIAACPLAFGEVGVKERVKSVMNYKKPAFWIIILAVIICITVALCFLTDPVDMLDSDSDFVLEDVIATVSVGDELDDNITLNGDTLILENDGGFWYFEKGQNIDVSITFKNDGSSMSMKTVGYIYCGDGSKHLYSNKIFSNQDVGKSNGSFKAPESGYYLFCFRNYSASWLQLTSFDVKSDPYFQATILEVHDGYFLVAPVEGSWELSSADRIEVPMKNMDPSLAPEIGDTIEISYNGEILESYPARLSGVYSIKVIEEAQHWDLIPMVMVDGELYLDTGYESTIEGRCGVMDGQITSEVDGSKRPTVNDQSNFGTGFDYQYGSTEGTIEIFMNGKWWIFATEEARHEMQFTPQSESNNKFYLTIGAEGVTSIELSMPGSSGGCANADGSPFKMGERIWLEPLDDYTDLRGLVITAINQEGKTVWTASIPNTEENEGFTYLRNDDWIITNLP